MLRLFVCGALLLWLAAVALAQPGDAPGDDLSNATGSASAQQASPSADTLEEYFRVVRTAIAEYEAGRFAEARALFSRAHELWPSARTWRTLGMTAFELSLYPTAQLELQRALDDPRRSLGEAQRMQVRTLLEQTRAFLGRYHVRLTPAHAALRLDGAPTALTEDGSLWLGVGRHELQAQAPGFSDLRVELVVQGREDEPLELALEATVRPVSADLRVPPAVSRADSLSTNERLAAAGPWADRPEQKRRRAVGSGLVLGSAAVTLSVGASLLAAGVRAHTVASSPLDQSLSYEQWRHKRDSYPRLIGTGGALLGAGVLALAAGVWWKLSSHGASAQLASDGRALYVRGHF